MLNFKIRLCSYVLRLIKGLQENILPLLWANVWDYRKACLNKRIQHYTDACKAIDSIHERGRLMQDILKRNIKDDSKLIEK